jgi:hypothetical protein
MTPGAFLTWQRLSERVLLCRLCLKDKPLFIYLHLVLLLEQAAAANISLSNVL